MTSQERKQKILKLETEYNEIILKQKEENKIIELKRKIKEEKNKDTFFYKITENLKDMFGVK